MIHAILSQILLFLPLVLGAYITLSLLKLPDFSLESAYLFGAVMGCVAQDSSLVGMLVCAVLGGCLVGAFVSICNQVLKLPFLLAAIVTNGLFHGVTQYVLGASLVSFHPFMPTQELFIFTCISGCLVLALGLGLRSQLGYSFAVYGNNPSFFQYQETSGKYVLFIGVMLGHSCAALSGFLFAGSNGFVDLTMNYGIILLCLTALILGRLFLLTPRPHVLVPLLGTAAYFVIQQSLVYAGLNLKYFNALQALCVLAVLSLGHRKQKMTLDHLGV